MKDEHNYTARQFHEVEMILLEFRQIGEVDSPRTLFKSKRLRGQSDYLKIRGCFLKLVIQAEVESGSKSQGTKHPQWICRDSSRQAIRTPLNTFNSIDCSSLARAKGFQADRITPSQSSENSP